VLPEYRGSDAVAIYAVYPCRDFMPTKVNALIEFLSDLYGTEPYWDKAFDQTTTGAAAKAASKAEASARATARAAGTAAATRTQSAPR
jgi:hypothetical protein